MNATIKSISLSYEEVQGVLERYINEQLLRTPHRIVDIDPCDYDAHNALQFNLHLEPAPIAVAAPEFRPLPLHIGPLHNGAPDGKRTIIDVALDLGRNGHIAATQETAAPAPTPAIMPQPALVQAPADGRKSGGPRRRITPEQRERIIELVKLNTRRKVIAATVGVAESVIYAVTADARAQGLLPKRTGAVVA